MAKHVPDSYKLLPATNETNGSMATDVTTVDDPKTNDFDGANSNHQQTDIR